MTKTTSMRRRLALVQGGCAALSLLAGCTLEADTRHDSDGSIDNEPVSQAQESLLPVDTAITPPSTLGTYCSKLTDLSGGWRLSTRANQTQDPCNDGITTTRISRRGFYSIAGWNSVSGRCGDGFLWVSHGSGTGPIDTVRSKLAGRRDCVVTIAPREMPIFRYPYRDAIAGNVRHNNGFDFAFAGTTINTLALGTGNKTASQVVDHRGRDKAGSGEHGGHDWGGIAEGDEVKAVAAGRVILVHEEPTPGCNTPIQKEIVILHKVVAPQAGVTEYFLSSYAHMKDFVTGITPGTTPNVTKGQKIGTVGQTGCASGPHIHFGIHRLSNTASKLLDDIGSSPTRNRIAYETQAVDPFGWAVTCGHHADCVDPWGWKAYPKGAFSTNFWDPARTPPTSW